MKQIIRNKVFETNSSSTHVLSIINKEDFEKFKSGDFYYCRSGEKEFISRDEIPNLDEFKEEGYNINNIEDFIYDYCDADYAILYTNDYLDYCAKPVFDSEGKEKIAFSVYITG